MLVVDCVSDLHGERPRFKGNADMLVVAGDLGYERSKQAYEDVLDWLEEQDYDVVVVVPGNHDAGLNEELFYRRRKARFLVDKLLRFRGRRIYGTPWTGYSSQVDPCCREWMVTEDVLAEKFKKIPEGLDLLVSHSPPVCVLDMNKRGANCGSISLADEVYMKNPKCHVFGHIHECGGKEHILAVESRSTTFYNVSYVDADYEARGNVRRIEI